MSMLGVILCGGQSTRMGSDKGLLTSRHLTSTITWAQLAEQKLASLTLPVVLSIHSQQYPSYASLFADSRMVIDNPELHVGGPLKGLLSVHQRFPDRDLFVLACDLPKMQPHVLEELLSHYEKQEAEIIVFKNGEQTEPLCGLYRAGGLNKINAAYEQGKLVKHSMHHILDMLTTHFIPLRKEWQSSFQNFNSPDDLA